MLCCVCCVELGRAVWSVANGKCEVTIELQRARARYITIEPELHRPEIRVKERPRTLPA